MANQTTPVIQIKDSNVGIGTTTPITQLHVNDGVNVSNLTMLTLSQLGNTSDRDIVNLKMSFNNGAVPGVMLSAIKMAGAGSSLSFSTGAAANGSLGEKMRITSGGNVLIGTTTDSGFKLDVNGTGRFTDVLRAARAIINDGVNSTDGIKIVGSLTSSAFTSGIEFIRTTVSGGSKIQPLRNIATGGVGFSFLVTANNTDEINATYTSAAVITEAGNVGIGTTAPEQKLQISGTSVGSDGSQTNISAFVNNGIKITGSLDSVSQDAITYQSGSGGGAALALGRNSGYGTYVAFYTNNTAVVGAISERMRITSAGNVGIGTTSPDAKLQVVGSFGLNGADSNYPFFVTDTSTATNRYNLANKGMGFNLADDYAQLQIFGGNGAYIDFANAVEDFDARLIYFGGSRLELQYGTSLTITPTGVGIGTTAPQSMLQVARTGNSNGGTILMGPGGSGTSKWSFLAGTHYNQATGSGNGSGSAGVAIIGADATENSNSVYIGGGPYEINPATVILFNTYTETTHNLGGLERMRITSGGNVLIGTTTDSGFKLDVAGTFQASSSGIVSKIQTSTNATEVLQIFNSGGNSGSVSGVTHLGINFFAVGTNSPVRISAFQNSTSGFSGGMFFSTRSDNSDVAPTEKVRILSGGNVGIGTDVPDKKLVVYDASPDNGLRVTNSDGINMDVRSGSTGGIVGTNSNHLLSFHTNNTERAQITAAGNFGIGNTPSYKLDVTGDVRINTGALGVNFAPSATDGRIDASNDIVAFNSSDERLKENITPITNALDKVKSLTGVEFDWKPEHKKAHGHEGRDTGIIAQQVLAVMPTAVRTNNTGFLAVRYEKLIGLLIEGMKEQQAQIDELKAQINDSSR